MHPSLSEVRWETQCSILKTGTEVEAMEECCLVVFSPWFVQPDFLSTQDHQLKGSTLSLWDGPPIMKMYHRLA